MIGDWCYVKREGVTKLDKESLRTTYKYACYLNSKFPANNCNVLLTVPLGDYTFSYSMQ